MPRMRPENHQGNGWHLPARTLELLPEGEGVMAKCRATPTPAGLHFRKRVDCDGLENDRLSRNVTSMPQALLACDATDQDSKLHVFTRQLKFENES